MVWFEIKKVLGRPSGKIALFLFVCVIILSFWTTVFGDEYGELVWVNEQGDAEYAISMAATLCMHALDTGAAAGFSANMPLTGETDCVFLPPENGEVARERLLAAFARLKIVRTLRFETFLARLPAMCGVHILVLSRYDSEEIQSALAQLRRMGNHTSLYLMKGGENA